MLLIVRSRAVVDGRVELASLQRRLNSQLSDELLHAYSSDRALVDTAPLVQQHNDNVTLRLNAQLRTVQRTGEWQKEAAQVSAAVNGSISQQWKRQQNVKRQMQTTYDTVQQEGQTHSAHPTACLSSIEKRLYGGAAASHVGLRYVCGVCGSGSAQSTARCVS